MTDATKPKKQECEFCVKDGGHVCNILHVTGYYCTRPVGHSGPHVACANSCGMHNLRLWHPLSFGLEQEGGRPNG